jgi:hypothetical protein
MNSNENKAFLWNTLLQQKAFHKEISVERTQELFETTLLKFNTIDENSLFLNEFTTILQHELLEKRMLRKQEIYKQKSPTEELNEIKKLLYIALDKLEKLS